MHEEITANNREPPDHRNLRIMDSELPPTTDEKSVEESEDASVAKLQELTEVVDGGPALPLDLMDMIFMKLHLRDFVRLRLACSKTWRSLASSKRFEGEPFYLWTSEVPDANPPWLAFYEFSMQRRVRLLLPSSVRRLKPVRTSGGLVLFSGLPNDARSEISRFRQLWWPLIVVNPITRDEHELRLMLEPGLDLSFIYMGLKVNADSKTFRVVVVCEKWKSAVTVVKTFHSSSNQWSTVQFLHSEVKYEESSQDIICCRNHIGSDYRVFDMAERKLVECEGFEGSCMPPDDSVYIVFSCVGESCLYGIEHHGGRPGFTLRFVAILKRERSDSTRWQIVTEVSLELLHQYLGFDHLDISHYCGDIFTLSECGNFLLFTAEYHGVWCAMQYDMAECLWSPHFLTGSTNDQWAMGWRCGLFFQSQPNMSPF